MNTLGKTGLSVAFLRVGVRKDLERFLGLKIYSVDSLPGSTSPLYRTPGFILLNFVRLQITHTVIRFYPVVILPSAISFEISSTVIFYPIEVLSENRLLTS